MLEKLKILEERFNELSKMLIQPDIISDQSKYIKISKEYKDLKTVVDKKNEYENVLANIEEAKDIIKNENDKEMIDLANQELNDAKNNPSKLFFNSGSKKTIIIPTKAKITYIHFLGLILSPIIFALNKTAKGTAN